MPNPYEISLAQAPPVPMDNPRAYDIFSGVDYNTKQEMDRIRQAQGGAGMAARAEATLPYMESFAKGRESAARIAQQIQMARAAKQTAGMAATGGPLAQRAALTNQANLNTQIGGAGAAAIAEEQQKAQQQYINAAQAQRKLDIQKRIGLEEIAQREMGMGLQSKWNAAQAQMEFEREKIRKAGIDLGVWDAAQKLATARNAALYGAIGAGSGTVMSYLTSLGQGGGGNSGYGDIGSAIGGQTGAAMGGGGGITAINPYGE